MSVMSVSLLDCSCGFGPRFDLVVFSPEWHAAHRDQHLRSFPDVDEGTRRNLDDFIVWAASAR